MGKVKLTGMQETAINAPCFVGEECNNPRFFRWREHRGRNWRIGLTANIGEE
jgi:hypothetical protein